MSIANEISKLQQNLLDCYGVCADNGAYLPEDINFDNLANCIEQISNPFNKPADWSDIRKDCPVNSIALYAAHATDFSQYDNLGFTATCIGGYNVFIDGTQYGSTYASGAKCSITWSTSGITTGDDITTPSTLKAHKIWIEPATEGNNITAFKHQRVTEGSDYEQQGTLWIHFNITNAISLDSMCSPYPYTFGPVNLTAVTAKNNIIDCGNSFTVASFNISALTYVPTIKNGSITSIAFSGSGIQKVTLDSCSFGDNSNYCFNACHNLKDVKLKNPTFIQNGKFVYTFYETMLKTFPSNWDWTNVVEAQDIWTDYDRANNDGIPTVIDARAGTGIKILGLHDTNTLVGLRVSNQAPFDSSTTPQLDIHNTALDRAALVQLFNDLPYNVGYEVVGSPTINNGIMTDTSYEDYVKTSSALDLTSNDKLEFSIRFKTPRTLVNGFYTLLSPDVWSSSILAVTSSNTCYLAGYCGDLYQVSLSNDTYYRAKLVKERNSNIWTVYCYDDNSQLLGSTSQEKVATDNNPILIGAPYGSASPAIQAIDLPNTSISVNNIPWFKGTASMTKTLSCVGCTGTADLTAEDKDIALNKGWSLTLS